MQTACQSGFQTPHATPVAASTCRPKPSVPYEPMFDSSKNISTRLANAADLLIDFATLGEYGLEPAAKPSTSSCETRNRRSVPPASSATNRRRRPGAPILVLAIEEPRSRRKHQIDGPFLLRP